MNFGIILIYFPIIVNPFTIGLQFAVVTGSYYTLMKTFLQLNLYKIGMKNYLS